MSMTKKDYELTAMAIRRAGLGPAITARFTESLVEAYADDNPRFQPDTFRSACRSETVAQRRKSVAGREAAGAAVVRVTAQDARRRAATSLLPR